VPNFLLNIKRSVERARRLEPTIGALRRSDITSRSAIAEAAEALTAKSIPTAHGGSVWSAVQVSRVLARIDH